MEKDLVLTKEGVEQLNKEYRNLIDVQRPDVIEALKNARAMGDLSENADYDAARNRQAEVEARIKEIESILANAKIVEEKKGRTINISNTVKFKDLSSGEIIEVKIVSSIESDPLNNPKHMKVSNECSLGVALIGKKAGDKVTVRAVEPYDIEILEVK
ncbi:MAG: transcription elongation factor GreA [Bacilli bacterium]|jgi:transcription elongation factor GreA